MSLLKFFSSNEINLENDVALPELLRRRVEWLWGSFQFGKNDKISNDNKN